ncbi:MAG: hypothetical protein JW889_16925 [Verrucomicrobia bacterium]|nr:hypothetical protein [Verrucomicrobiota bacterium]
MNPLVTGLAQLREFEPDGTANAVAGLVFLVIMVGGVICGIIFLVAVWRLMKAHESIGRSLQRTTVAQESIAHSVYTIAQGQGPSATPPPMPDFR